MTNDTYASFRPFGPVPWWCWVGEITKPEMVRQLQLMKDQGIDEFFIYPSMGLENLHFLQDDWFEHINFALKEARRRNMRVWIYDDLNWPSGTAAGYFLRTFPQYRMRSLQRTCVTLDPGEDFALAITPKATAIFVRDAETKGPWKKVEVDIDNFYRNDTDGKLELWSFEDKIFNWPTLGVRGIKESWHQQGLCNLLDADAVRAWMSCLHDKYYEYCGHEFGKTLQGFFFDEPSCMPNYGELPWTPGMEKMFTDAYGYDVRDHLCEFYEDTPGSEKTRYDFWTLYAGLTSRNFGQTVAAWCTEHGVKSTGHCVYEEITNQNLRLFWNGENHGILKHQHIPGMDLLTDNTPYHLGTAYHWYGKTDDIPRTFIFTAKQVCSTARYSGAERVLAEAMGVCNLNAPLVREKLVFDWLAASGVSLLNENCMTYTIRGYTKRTISNKSWYQPWFRNYRFFSEYVREMSSFAAKLLQCNVAILTPETHIRACTWVKMEEYLKLPEKADVSKAMVDTLNALMRSHIDSELIFEDIFLDAPIQDRCLLAPRSQFSVLLLPRAGVLTQELADKVRAFKEAGGTVFCIQERPNRTPDGSPLDFQDLPLVAPEEVPAAIRGAVPQPYDIADDGELFTALRGDSLENSTLFIANMGNLPADATVTVHTLPSQATVKIIGTDEEWPWDGKALHLEPEQSLFIKFNGTPSSAMSPLVYGTVPPSTSTLTGTWAYTLSRPNTALLPWQLGLAPNDEVQQPEKVGMWLDVTPDGNYDLDFSPEESPFFWLRTTFTADSPACLEGLSVIAEEQMVQDVYINGEIVPGHKMISALWTQENIQFDIEKQAKIGENQLLLLCRTSYWNGIFRRNIFPLNFLEPVVLHGNFTVIKGECPVSLHELPEALAIGDLGKQGFPYYVGDISYKRSLPPMQEAPNIGFAPPGGCGAEIICNGRSCGFKLWSPYRYPLVDAWHTDKANSLEIKLSSTLGNMMPRAYGCRKIRPTALGLLEAPFTF